MNNSIKLLVLVFITLLSSCSSDDESNQDTNSNKGFLKIGSQTVELSQGYLENYGVRGNAYNIDFSVRSKTISEKEDGAVVYFELFSSLQNNLAKGDYSFAGYSEATAYTFTKWGQSLLGKNINPGKGDLSVSNGVSIRPLSGTFKVSENGQKYKVSFTGKGTASFYKDGVLASTQNDVAFSMQYFGDVKKSEGKTFTAKKISSTELLQKNHSVIFN
ncbi:hypothetical protein HNP37_004630 [Flavobacterium nitrogenifigens]|uniref:Lipoprotein n=2 Tax=Flavobacterium TaxID=237 RepID=A0A7W7J1K4_9FLAO|nr:MULTISPECIES: hypothetical protein [Flavobacterium]MBB4804533.1 hypothetical protein [Flavobacterium nitrogenifigens]MBB6389492.1 hypothetical protein [Flavobacterium notoginsengisoli]